MAGIVCEFQDDGHFLAVVRLQHQRIDPVTVNDVRLVDEASVNVRLLALWLHVKANGMLSADDDTLEGQVCHVGIGYHFVFGITQCGAHARQREIQLGHAVLDGGLHGHGHGTDADGSRSGVPGVQESAPQLVGGLVGGLRHLFCGGAYGAVCKEHQFGGIGVAVDAVDVVERGGGGSWLEVVAHPADDGGSVGKAEGARVGVAGDVRAVNLCDDSRAHVIGSACKPGLECGHESFDVGGRSAHQARAFRADADESPVIALQLRIVGRAPARGVGNIGHIACQGLGICGCFRRFANGSQTELNISRRTLALPCHRPTYGLCPSSAGSGPRSRCCIFPPHHILLPDRRR